MINKTRITIATRKSELAMWQARHVAGLLQRQYPEIEIELLPMQTQGDRMLDQPLATLGGKGLFLKELELALLSEEADLAVHSMKDVPVLTTPELSTTTISGWFGFRATRSHRMGWAMQRLAPTRTITSDCSRSS